MLPLRVQIGLATFGILALELALIRWTSSQIRIFAYFNNLVLIVAFLGMGLGVALGQRRPGLVHGTLPLLALLAVPLAFAEPLGLASMPFPDQSVHLWGAEAFEGSALHFLVVMVVFLALVGLIVAVFLCAGSIVGDLFTRVPALRAYSADLLGSLAGILAFSAATYFAAPPWAWLLIGGLPFLCLSRRVVTAISLAGIAALAGYSARFFLRTTGSTWNAKATASCCGSTATFTSTCTTSPIGRCPASRARRLRRGSGSATCTTFPSA
jgi:hypothetical protein